MKLIFIARQINPNIPSGVAKTAWYLYKEFKKYKRIEIELITIKNAEDFTKNTLKMFLVLWKHWKEKGLIYVHHNDDILPALPLIFRNPSVIVVHDLIPLIVGERRWFYRLYFLISLLILKILIKIGRRMKVMVPSETTKKDLVRFGINKNKIFVVRWGVDHNLYKPVEMLQKQKYKRNEIWIGFLGAFLSPKGRKRVDILLKAYIILKKRYPNIKLVFAGRYYKEFIDKCRKYGVEYLGILPEGKVPEFYNTLDIFVYPSKYEGFGLQVLEAMSCRTLVLASDIPVFREILPKELLFNLNEHDLVKKIEEFLDKEKIKKYSEKLYKISLKFEWVSCVKRILKILCYDK